MAEHGLNGRVPILPPATGRVWKLAALVALVLLLTSASAGIAQALQGPDLASLWPSVVFGLLVGWVLGAYGQPPLRTTVIVLAAGFVYILLLPGGLLGKIFGLTAELSHLAGGLRTYLNGEHVDLAELGSRTSALISAIGAILGRIQAWVLGLMTGEPVFDPAAAALVWHAMLWGAAAWAGWTIIGRRNALLAAAPALLLSMNTLAASGQTSFALYLMLVAVLLALAIVQQEERQRLWERTGVAYPGQKGGQIIGVAAIAAIGLVLISALSASLSLDRLQEWISKLREPAAQQDEGLAGSLGIVSEGADGGDVIAAALSPGLPRDHLIGSGPELSERLVMTVVLPGPLPVAANGQAASLYWRSFTYDIYTGQGWSSSRTEKSAYGAGEPFGPARNPNQILLQQRVLPVEDLGGTLYAAGEPISVSLSAETAWRSTGDLFGTQLAAPAGYDAVSAVPVPNERALRNAGQRYPDWVRQRYLQLPPEVPGRVRALATRLTAAQSAPYDRARAIEQYLRSYPYTLEVERPSVNQDVVDFFLFDLKRGYCDYYASAMAVLARASGVPARLAVGYAGGTYNLNSKRFVVTEADSHSWVEIYFPRIGWVPFEPTAARPALDRQPLVAHDEEQDLIPVLEAPLSPGSGSIAWRGLLLAGLALAGTLGAAWAVLDELRLQRLSPAARATEVYRRMRRLGQALQTPSTPGDTPHEFSAALGIRLTEIGSRMRRASYALRMVRDIDKIANGVVLINYGPWARRDLRILPQWGSLRWRLRWLRALQLLNRILDQLRRDSE